MNKKLIWALILIAVSAVVLILNSGRMDVNLPFYVAKRVLEPIVFLTLIADGVAIGLLLQ